MSLGRVPPLIALTSESTRVDPTHLSLIAAALQKQVIRDFAPAWGITATVAGFPDPRAIPPGYWRIAIKDRLDEPGAAGYHTDEHGQPLSLVEWGGTIEETCITCSHELLEMLADPWGSRLVVCSVPMQNGLVRARALVEVCDPSEAYHYDVDGLPVSDFVTPRYYGPHHWGRAHPGAYAEKLSFLAVLEAPLTIRAGGYLSYVLDDGKWWQTTWFGGAAPAYRDISDRLAELEGQGSLRAAIDRVTSAEAGEYIDVFNQPEEA